MNKLNGLDYIYGAHRTEKRYLMGPTREKTHLVEIVCETPLVQDHSLGFPKVGLPGGAGGVLRIAP